MIFSQNNYCLILAGGVGSRLWPMSRENKPKQYLDIGGSGRTIIQQTYDRFAAFIKPENIYISTVDTYLDLLREQLPQVPRSQVLAEPLRRGTLAPVTWATSAISHINPDACIVVSPADQIIYDNAAFQNDILQGLEFVSHNDGVITIGVPPTRPETNYGYVQAGNLVDGQTDIYHVKTFTEKPDATFAQMFMDSGEFLWNTGLFLFGAHYMLHNIVKHVPEYRDEFPELADLGFSADTEVVPRYYNALPNLSMEYAVLERTGHNYVQKCHFGWADLGSWQSIATDLVLSHSTRMNRPSSDVKVDGRGNVTLHSEALFDNATGNIVSLPHGHLAVISGLDDFVVAERDGVIMVCPRNDLAAMRRLQTLANLNLTNS